MLRPDTWAKVAQRTVGGQFLIDPAGNKEAERILMQSMREGKMVQIVELDMRTGQPVTSLKLASD